MGITLEQYEMFFAESYDQQIDGYDRRIARYESGDESARYDSYENVKELERLREACVSETGISEFNGTMHGFNDQLSEPCARAEGSRYGRHHAGKSGLHEPEHQGHFRPYQDVYLTRTVNIGGKDVVQYMTITHSSFNYEDYRKSLYISDTAPGKKTIAFLGSLKMNGTWDRDPSPYFEFDHRYYCDESDHPHPIPEHAFFFNTRENESGHRYQITDIFINEDRTVIFNILSPGSGWIGDTSISVTYSMETKLVVNPDNEDEFYQEITFVPVE